MMYKLNTKREVKDIINSKFNDFDNLYIAVSFIRKEGIEELFNLDNFNDKVKIITTTDDYITDPYIIQLLYDKGCDIRLIDENKKDRSFHSKFIIAEKGGIYKTMLGSLNLTKKSILNKYESVYFDSDKSLLDHFSILYEYSDKIEQSDIDKYKEKYEIYNKEISKTKREIEFRLKIQNSEYNEMQKNVLSEIRQQRLSGVDSVILYAATGTGKTLLSAFDLKRVAFKKAIFIVHSRLIIKASIKSYEIVFPDLNLLELNTKNGKLIEDSNIIFTTQNTINKYLEDDPNWLKQYDYFIFDEAHKIGENNIQGKILNKVKELEKKFILAMSATPWRSNDPSFLFENFGHRIVGNINLRKAIEMNLVSDFNYRGVDIDSDFSLEDLSEISLKEMVDKFISEVDKLKVWDETKVKGIIFTKNIREANKVTEIINSNYVKYNCVSIHSKMKEGFISNQSEEISTYIERLQNENNKLNFLVTVDMFNEGVDIPRINTIGMFRFTNSNIIYTQQIGRGLRSEGDQRKYLNIIDLVGMHENSFERISGLKGIGELHPRDLIDIISEPEKHFTNFYISEVSKEKILSTITKNVSYRKYFNNQLSKYIMINNKIPKLYELENIFNDSIQVIVNSFRENPHFTKNSVSWIVNLLSKFDSKYNSLDNEENVIIEMFSWIPFICTTTEEKIMVLDLIKGKETKLNSKLQIYFYGEKNDWSFIFQETRRYFNLKEDKLIFKREEYSKGLINEVLNDITEYLRKNLRDDNNKLGVLYSRLDVQFMNGNVKRAMEPLFKTDKSRIMAFVVSVDNEGYTNKVLAPNEYILSTRGKNDLDMSKKYIAYIGKKIFGSKYEMFMYVGEQSKPMENVGKKIHKKREFNIYKLITKQQISKTDLLLLSL